MVKKNTGSAASSRRNTWDLSPLFKGDEDPKMAAVRKAVEKKSYAFINKWKDRRDYLEKPEVLRQALHEYEVWRRSFGTDGDEGYYFWLRTQQDQNDTDLKARFNRIEEFGRKIENDIQFFYLRLAKIPARRQKSFLSDPRLEKYRHFLQRIFAEAKYHLSEPEEKIMNLKASTSYGNWVRMTSGFLAKEERKIVLEDGTKKTRSFAEITSLMNSRIKKTRDSAADAFNDIIKKHIDVAEAEVNSILANKKIDDELRGLARPDLARHIGDDIESPVVDRLVDVVSGRFDIARRYYRLKADMMKVKRLKYHERNVEIGKVKKGYSYQEGSRLVMKVMTGLDQGFADIFRSFTEGGHIDVYPRKGKVSGAFCAHHMISQPTFILLNHTNRLNDVLTLAHELGHGINNELIRKKQHALYFGTSTATAEVASTFMEDFVLEEILRHSSDEEKLAIMMMKLNDDVSTIFRQISCYMFEQDLHKAHRKKGYLSSKEIGALFQGHMAAYMGDAVEQSEGAENWWVYWSHIRSFFYVYSYAGGLLISKALQSSVKKDKAFIVKVREFLSAGLSESPGNTFLKLGIDIRDAGFWESGISEVERLLAETERLAKKLGKLR